MRVSAKGVVTSAIIAAAYVVLTLPFASFTFGPVQFRVAEVLTILPFLSHYAIYGCFVGCFVSNMLGSTPLDMVVGSAATLLAAILTYKCKNLYLSTIPPIVVNAVAIGTMLAAVSGSFSVTVTLGIMGSIALSQTVVCFGLGVPFIKLLKRCKLDRYIATVKNKKW